jgi:hypothetical protein
MIKSQIGYTLSAFSPTGIFALKSCTYVPVGFKILVCPKAATLRSAEQIFMKVIIMGNIIKIH